MASAAEQLAANINLKAFANATVLKKRILFTLAALIVYRFGSYIPLPGINPTVMSEIAHQNAGGILAMFDMLAGGALSRMSIFALNIMPYISASIIVQLLTAVYPPFEALKKEGESGRKRLNQYTRYGTLFLSIIQAYGIAVGLEAMRGSMGVSAVMDPGFLFRFEAVVTLVGGTVFLMWLGEQITSRGVGNGISLIIFAGIVANLPQALLSTLELGRTGALSAVFIAIFMIAAILVIAFIVFMERAQRRILIQYPKRQVGTRIYGGESTHLPLKINSSGVIPPIFANALLLLPVTLSGMLSGDGSTWYNKIAHHIAQGQALYILFYIALIVFFSFFYTAIVFNPEETAQNLKKSGGFVLGIRPGKQTSDYFDYILTRLTVLGAAYLSAVCVLPEVIKLHYTLPFYFGGTSLLIVVSVTMDTVAQIHSHLIAHQYEGLLKKSKLKGPGI